MSAEAKHKKASWFGRQVGTAAIAGMVILSSSFWSNAQAADKDMAKGMPAMDMRQLMMSGMKELESMPMSGDTDYDFAMMMKKHHQNALDMADVELQKGKDPTLRSMANGIIKSQTKEIKAFDQWLAKHKKPMAEPMSKAK